MLSIVINVKNGEAFLDETLRSATAQTAPVEILVIDNQSTDRTPEIVERYPRVKRIVTPEPMTLGAARNFSLQFVSSPFVAWLDADDLWEATFAERTLRVMTTYPNCAMVTTGTICIDEKGRELTFLDPYQRFYRIPRWRINADAVRPGDFLEGVRLRMRPRWAWCAHVFRTGIIRRVGGFDTSLVYSEDLDIIVKVLGEGGALHIPANLTRYRRHSNQDTRRLSAETIYAEKLKVVTRRETSNQPLEQALLARMQRVTHLKYNVMRFRQERNWRTGVAALRSCFDLAAMAYLLRVRFQVARRDNASLFI